VGFQHNGQQLKCLTLIDEFTKEALAIDVAGSIRSTRVIEVLSRVMTHRGAPAYLRSDNGPEFVATALLKWATRNGIETALIDPGKPWQNGTTESFNGRFRDECLSVEWFRNRLEARVVIRSDVERMAYGPSQSSTFRPGMRSNSRRLRVTTDSPSERACAPIRRSWLPIGVPARSSDARISA
jgi:transposase InsO family protein